MKTVFSKPSNISLLLICVAMTVVSSNLNWGKDHWRGIIEVDGKGYYAYLPAVFIYHDLNFGFFEQVEEQEYYDKNYYYDYRAHAEGKTIDKYYCGTAFAELPFFLIAHTITGVFDLKKDGYSSYYPIFVNIAALFYMLSGLLFLNASMSHFQVKEWDKSLVLWAVVFGTNLFYYTVGEPGMSHVYSFAFISGFIYYGLLYFSDFKKSRIIALGFLLGMIVLIRPVNGIVIFILPFLAGSFDSLKNGILKAFQKPFWLILGILGFVFMVSIQFLIYKISTGKFFVYSYTNEGFDFLNPHFIDILISYKKGLFLYTPLYLVSFVGLWFLAKNTQFAFWSVAGFFIFLTYILSSWTNWYYGGSFSGRVFVEYLPFFMILMALALKNLASKNLKPFFVTAILLLIVLCQIQTYQYRYYQIHWSDMTKERYWEVFLKVKS